MISKEILLSGDKLLGYLLFCFLGEKEKNIVDKSGKSSKDYVWHSFMFYGAHQKSPEVINPFKTK